MSDIVDSNSNALSSEAGVVQHAGTVRGGNHDNDTHESNQEDTNEHLDAIDDDISMNSIITAAPEQIVDGEDFMGEGYREMHTYSGRLFQRIKFWWLRNVTSGRTLHQLGKSTHSRGIALYDLDPQGNEIHRKSTDYGYRRNDNGGDDADLENGWGTAIFDVPSLHHGIPFIGRLTVPQLLTALAVSALVLYFLIEIIITSNDEKRIVLSRINTHGFNPFITYSNGTSVFNPITIVLKINNFHPSIISERRTPLLSKLFLRGNGRIEDSSVLDGLSVVSAAYMVPMFPLLDIPNMWSMVTGLYPYNHGHICSTLKQEEEEEEEEDDNDDDDSGKDADHDEGSDDYRFVKRRLHARTGNNSPIWSQLQRAYLNDGNYVFKAAVHNSWSQIVELERKKDDGLKDKDDGISKESLNRYEPFYNMRGSDKDTVKRIFELIDFNDIDDRPQLIMDTLVDFEKYTFDNGYDFEGNYNVGDTASEFDRELFKLDTVVRDLLYHIKKRNLQTFTNVLLLSNYGINNVEQRNIIKYSDLVSKSIRKKKIIERARFEGSMVFISVRGKAKNEVYTDITKNVEQIPGVKVYLTGKLPEQFKLNGRNRKLNQNLGDIVVIPERGYSIIDDTNKKQRKKYGKSNKEVGKNRYFGFDGYDYGDGTNVTMRSLFIGIGPYFKNNETIGGNNAMIRPFENIEVYEMISNICGLNERDRTRNRDSHSRMDLVKQVYTEGEYMQDDFESLRASFGDDSTYNVIFEEVAEQKIEPELPETPSAESIIIETTHSEHSTLEPSETSSLESHMAEEIGGPTSADLASSGYNDNYVTEESTVTATQVEDAGPSVATSEISKTIEPETETKIEPAIPSTTNGNILDIGIDFIGDLLDDAKDLIDDIIDKIHIPDYDD